MTLVVNCGRLHGIWKERKSYYKLAFYLPSLREQGLKKAEKKAK